MERERDTVSLGTLGPRRKDDQGWELDKLGFFSRKCRLIGRPSWSPGEGC